MTDKAILEAVTKAIRKVTLHNSGVIGHGFNLDEHVAKVLAQAAIDAAQPDTHVIQAATAAERKRCAEIARGAWRAARATLPPDWNLNAPWSQAIAIMDEAIAKAIENPET